VLVTKVIGKAENLMNDLCAETNFRIYLRFDEVGSDPSQRRRGSSIGAEDKESGLRGQANVESP
jgi:hypothetical protein